MSGSNGIANGHGLRADFDHLAGATLTRTADATTHSDILNLKQFHGIKGSDRIGIIRQLLDGVAEVEVAKSDAESLIYKWSSDTNREMAQKLIAAFVERFGDIKSVISSKKDRSGPLRDAVRHIRHEYGLNNPISKNARVSFEGIPDEKLTPRQKEYKAVLLDNASTLAHGPAGTGKTSVALDVALELYNQGKVKSIRIIKPVTIAKNEERITGALKGGMEEKIDPYFISITNLLSKKIGSDRLATLRDKGVIQYALFSNMRGDNFEDEFVLVDEAQNLTPEQMRMVMTRMADSMDASMKPRIAIIGDLDQKDTPPSVKNGLLYALVHYTPQRMPQSSQIQFGEEDIRRSDHAYRAVVASKAPDPSHPLIDRYNKEFGINVEQDIPLPASAMGNRYRQKAPAS